MTDKSKEMKESVDIDSAISAYVTALRKRGSAGVDDDETKK